MFGNSDGFPLSDAYLESVNPKNKLYDILAARNVRSRSFEVYDFNIKALDTTNVWTVAAGGTATTWAVRAEAGGWIRGVTGTTTASAALQIYQPQKYWTGTAKAGVAFLWRSDVVQGVTYEMGFVNALPAINTTVINSDTATPTFNTSVDVAMFLYRHAGNATAAPDSVGLYAANSSASTTQRTLATVATLGASPGPAADTEHFVALEVIGTTVYCWIGNSPTPLKLTSAVTAANGLVPFFSVKGNNSTSKNADIDAIVTWSGRLG
jgi:hypothetical protein